MFFGVADLSDAKRKSFYDKWRIRAQKMHDDDLLLAICKRDGKPTTLKEAKIAPTTATSQRRQLDVTDQPCVTVVIPNVVA